MTNYNGRLDEILTTCDFEPDGFNSRICLWCGKRKGAKIHTAKQAITSLIKELVAEAKPGKHIVQEDSDIYDDYDHDREQLRHELQENNINIGHNSAINEFEQNILKALEEL